MFHDDGIYTTVARSMAEGHGHRIVSLPGEPYEAKYPPLYSALLSAVWRLFPLFPANILWLKTLNVLCLAAGLYGAALWARRSLRPFACVLFVVLLGTSRGIVGYSDYAMSEVAFLAFVVWYARLWTTDEGAAPRRADAAIALVSCGAVLTRSVGIALAVTSALECVRTREWKSLMIRAGLPLAAFAAWSVWAAWHRNPLDGQLVSYYTRYETSALQHLTSNPGLAVQIVSGNVALGIVSLPYPIGPGWQAVAPAWLLLSLIGLAPLARSGQRVPMILAVVYLMIVVVHPFAPHRYLIVVVPILLMAALAGADRAAALLTRANPAASGAGAAAILLAGLCLLWPNLVLLRERQLLPSNQVRGWYVPSLGYTWDGFDETFEWIRTSTPTDARLASMFDGTYFLHTGRQGVRPWIHQPETYFYPLRAPKPYVGEPRVVLAELRALGVQYVVLDPVAGFTEGPAAARMLRALLQLPEAASERLFTSRDGLHEVYRLGASHESTGVGVRGAEAAARVR